MNHATMPGFGDFATWGAFVSRTNGHELEHIDEVLIEGGTCILKYLDVTVHEDIHNHYERNAQAINKASTQPETEEPQ